MKSAIICNPCWNKIENRSHIEGGISKIEANKIWVAEQVEIRQEANLVHFKIIMYPISFRTLQSSDTRLVTRLALRLVSTSRLFCQEV